MLNKTDEELTALLYDKEGKLKEDAATLLIESDAARVTRLKEESTTKFNDGHAKGKSESLSKQEKDFKEKTGFVSDLTGNDLYIAYADSLKTTIKITDDDIKKHPLFLSLETSSVPKEDYQKIMDDFDNYKKDQTKGTVLKDVQTDAWSDTLKRNPNIEKGVVGEQRRKDFLEKLGEYDYEIVNNEKIVLKDGKRLETPHGALINFNSFVEGLANKHFTFAAQNSKESAGNHNKNTGTPQIPTNKAEYSRMVAEAKTPEERIAIKQAYDSARGAN
jgi:hypothetical protein